MQKYFDREWKLFQIAYQPSKGGARTQLERWLDMVKADLGKKRACLACGMRFYDLNRSPIECPGCGAEFDPENIIKSRKGRSAAKTVPRASVKETDDNQIGDDNDNELIDTVVNDNDDDDIVDDAIIDDDIEFESDNGLDVGDDGPGIIQDDIGDEDELMPSLDDKDEN